MDAIPQMKLRGLLCRRVAFSLSRILVYLGTQHSATLISFPRLPSFSRHAQTNFEVMVLELSAVMIIITFKHIFQLHLPLLRKC